MKVGNPIGSNTVRRGIVAVGLAWMLLAGSAAPLAAIAVPAPAQAAVETSGTVGSIDTTPVLAAAVPTTTVVPAAPVALKAAAAPAKKKKKKKRRRKLTMRQLVARVGRAKGLSRAEVRALLWMAKRESNFRPRVVSRSGCYGLFQLSGGMAHGHAWRNPTWNTRRAIRYMRGRYGGVLHAQRFWLSHRWY